jgi:hypothetical protein
MTLNQYLQMYKKPLSDSSMQAILKLSEVAVEKKEKKAKVKQDKKKIVQEPASWKAFKGLDVQEESQER